MSPVHLWSLLVFTTILVVGEKQIKLEDIERDNLDSARQLKQKQTIYLQQQQQQQQQQPNQPQLHQYHQAQTPIQPQQIAYIQAQQQPQSQQTQQTPVYPNQFPNLQFSPQFIQQLQQAYLQHAIRQLQAKGQFPLQHQLQQQQQQQLQQQQQSQPGPAYYILPNHPHQHPVQYYANQPVQYITSNQLDNNQQQQQQQQQQQLQRVQATQVVHVVQPPQHLPVRQAHFYQPQQQTNTYATIPYSVPVKQVQLTSVQKMPTGTKTAPIEESGFTPTATAGVHRQALQHPKHGVSYFSYRSGPGAF